METNQHIQVENPEDITTRLALISKAVEAQLLSRQQVSPETGAAIGQEPAALAVAACPIDPMERLLCESCQ